MRVLNSWFFRALQTEYRLKPFHGIRVCFVGFPEEEEEHMTEVLVMNGGTVTTLGDPTCTHVVSILVFLVYYLMFSFIFINLFAWNAAFVVINPIHKTFG